MMGRNGFSKIPARNVILKQPHYLPLIAAETADEKALPPAVTTEALAG
jgi:hypothetical protein